MTNIDVTFGFTMDTTGYKKRNNRIEEYCRKNGLA